MTEKTQALFTLVVLFVLGFCIFGSYRLAELEVPPESLRAVVVFLGYLLIEGCLIFSLVISIRRFFAQGKPSFLGGLTVFLSLLGIFTFFLLVWLHIKYNIS